jgi:hypothetical protein
VLVAHIHLLTGAPHVPLQHQHHIKQQQQQQQQQHVLGYSTLPRASPQQASTADSYDDDDEGKASSDNTASTTSSSSSSGPAAKAQQLEKPLRVERLLANLGYGKRQECAVMLKRRRVVYADSGKPAKVSELDSRCSCGWLQLVLGGVT